MDYHQNTDQNTGKQCVQEGKHRNAMLETWDRNWNKIGTGTGTGTGTKLVMGILRAGSVITEFEYGTEFWGSRELVRSCDCSASRADGFWGGTSAGGVTGD